MCCAWGVMGDEEFAPEVPGGCECVDGEGVEEFMCEDERGRGRGVRDEAEVGIPSYGGGVFTDAGFAVFGGCEGGGGATEERALGGAEGRGGFD